MKKLVGLINDKCEPLDIHQKGAYDTLLDKIGDANIVLIGEATHGTHEFYQIRADITRELILKKGFMAIAVEADWPDAYRVNRYVKGLGAKQDPESALSDFTRFPTWMWRNTTLLPFLKWLRTHNDKISDETHQVGFYGLDLYSMQSSIEAVLAYLETVDPKAAERAVERYACFDHLSIDPETYGYLTNTGMKEPCISQAIEQYLELQHNTLHWLEKDGLPAEEALFYATQNARLVKNAETYYRTHFEGRVSSWNIRDRHMAETLNVLSHHLEHMTNKNAKIVVWAHNSHVGDARATEMRDQGELNIGQLVREEYGDTAYLIGFSTYQGTVTAASEWGDDPEQKTIVPGMPGSYEALFHEVNHKNFLLHLKDDKDLDHYLHLPRLLRAIGVLYRPDTERESHYFFTQLPYQFDTIIHIDKSTAVQPINLSNNPLTE